MGANELNREERPLTDVDSDKARHLEQDIADAEADVRRRLIDIDRKRAELAELRDEAPGWQSRTNGNLVLKKDGYTATVWERTPGEWWWLVKLGAEFIDHAPTPVRGRAAAKVAAIRTIGHDAETRG